LFAFLVIKMVLLNIKINSKHVPSITSLLF
jgi:hypothetical protein